jgi:riboflavin synthase
LFTGIIEEKGVVTAIKRGVKSAVLTIGATKVFSDLKIGDSVAVNGVCLTVTSIEGNRFAADVMNETLSRSSLGDLRIGGSVNLERAMPAIGRFGGHIVSGHIDGTGTVSGIKKEDIAVWYTVRASPQIMRYIVEKGSVAIDGISLTVAKAERDRFSVSIIPHTAQETVLSDRMVGDVVNLENDVIGKYIEKLMAAPKGVTEGLLMENGFL